MTKDEAFDVLLQEIEQAPLGSMVAIPEIFTLDEVLARLQQRYNDIRQASTLTEIYGGDDAVS